jgi:V8-like Glu-specific endopeptidase
MADPARANEQLKGRIDRTADRRQAVLDNYQAGAWEKLAPVEQTVRALEHVEQYDLATEVLDRAARPPDREGEFEAIAAAADDGLGDRIFEQLIGQSEIMPIRFVHKGSQAAPSIGRLVVRSGRQPNGTGFLVSPRLLLTNFHVLPTQADAVANIVQFDFVGRADGSSSVPVEFELRPDVLFVQSPVERLDFALVAVEPTNAQGSELSRFGWCRLIAKPGKEHPGQRVNVIHHPAGNPKQVSLRENFLALILDDYLHYMTDTMRGSSGSPVFNDEWEVVALHHAGLEIDESEAEAYRQAIGSNVPAGVEPSGPVLVNEGARVSRIVAELQNQAGSLSGEARSLLEEALVAAPPGPEGAQLTDLAQVVARSDAGSFSIGAGPVTINVQVGGSRSGPARSVGSPVLELFKGAAEKSVVNGLLALERRREEPYLPTEAVLAERIDEYYGDLPDRVAAGALSHGELFDELNALISEDGTLSIASSFPERFEGLESAVSLESARYARSRAAAPQGSDQRARVGGTSPAAAEQPVPELRAHRAPVVVPRGAHRHGGPASPHHRPRNRQPLPR